MILDMQIFSYTFGQRFLFGQHLKIIFYKTEIFFKGPHTS